MAVTKLRPLLDFAALHSLAELDVEEMRRALRITS